MRVNKTIKNLVCKTIPTIGLSLIMLMSVGCSNAKPQSTPAKVPVEQSQETISVDKSICGIKVYEKGHYVVKENKLYQVTFNEKDLTFKELKALTKEQVKELEKFSAGKYIDHAKFEKKLFLDNEFIYLNKDKIIVLNSKSNKKQKKDKLELKMQEKYEKEINKSLNGFVLDLDKIK